MGVITLLTDFGTADGYVAAMKGVIRTIAPNVFIDDASHDIAPGDVHAAAWALGAYWQRYPAGTVHLVVVDPGVGSTRRAIAVRACGQLFVAPDNGVLSRVLVTCDGNDIATVDMDPPQQTVSSTFHGRDIFAPAAARLARGESLDALGASGSPPLRLELSEPMRSADAVVGEIIHVDRYGNLITNIPGAWLLAGACAHVHGRQLPLARTYSDVPLGTPLALVGSRDVLEISVRDGNAAEILGVERGDTVTVLNGEATAEANESPLR